MIVDNLPNEEKVCLFCGKRLVDGMCPNGCDIIDNEVENG